MFSSILPSQFNGSTTFYFHMIRNTPLTLITPTPTLTLTVLDKHAYKFLKLWEKMEQPYNRDKYISVFNYLSPRSGTAVKQEKTSTSNGSNTNIYNSGNSNSSNNNNNNFASFPAQSTANQSLPSSLSSGSSSSTGTSSLHYAHSSKVRSLTANHNRPASLDIHLFKALK